METTTTTTEENTMYGIAINGTVTETGIETPEASHVRARAVRAANPGARVAPVHVATYLLGQALRSA